MALFSLNISSLADIKAMIYDVLRRNMLKYKILGFASNTKVQPHDRHDPEEI
jgi:hypothetical protein